MTMRWVVSVFLFFPALLISGQPEESGELTKTVNKVYDTSGFIYGTVKLKDGSELEGVLRWGGQEQFWDDHFNGVKEKMPYQEYLPGEEAEEDKKKKKKKGLRLFGISLKEFREVWRNRYARRQFLSRFGDIQQIESDGDEHAIMVMKNKKRYGVVRSGDLGEDIALTVRGEKPRNIVWRDIESIRFKPAPADFPTPERRMFGTVQTRKGTYRGFIQWDREECLLSDTLDGYDDEKVSHKIPFSEIRKIKREGGRSSIVTLKNGKKLKLSRTNDVDRGNRGIDVEDARYGRIRVEWKAFKSIEFQEQDGSGSGFGDYSRQSLLHGKIWNKSGEMYMGRIVFDLDESERWEIMDGELKRVQFMIPFGEIDVMEPKSSKRCKVQLRNGQTVVLGDTTDVTEDNNGVLIYEYNDKGPVYLPWRDVKRIEFNNLGE